MRLCFPVDLPGHMTMVPGSGMLVEMALCGKMSPPLINFSSFTCTSSPTTVMPSMRHYYSRHSEKMSASCQKSTKSHKTHKWPETYPSANRRAPTNDARVDPRVRAHSHAAQQRRSTQAYTCAFIQATHAVSNSSCKSLEQRLACGSPSSMTQPGPTTTFGPIRQPSPITAVGS